MKKIMIMICFIILLAGCETPEKSTVAVFEEPHTFVEESEESKLELEFGVSEDVLKELEESTRQPSYFEGKKISDGYTREDYVSVTKIEDGDDKFYTYEIIMKDGEKNRVSFRKFLID